ncbi:MAG: dicarboxylate/amino acid:cation symporter [Planctomycetaceae bacterium]
MADDASSTPSVVPPPAGPIDSGTPHGSGRLTLYILLAIVLALVVAGIAPRFAMATAIGGEIFLNVLKMLVVPLVVTSVMSGVLGMGDVRKLGKPGAATLFYYLTTTAMAVVLGIVLVNVIRPGEGTVSESQRQAAAASTDEKAVKARRQATARREAAERVEAAERKLTQSQAALDEQPADDAARAAAAANVETAQRELREARSELNRVTETGWTILRGLVLMLFTDNLLESAVNADLLPLIAFSIVFAALLTTMPSRTATLAGLVLQANDAFMAFVLLLMKFAPIGIYCLVAARFGEARAEGELLTLLRQTGWYMSTVLIGLAIHSLVVLPAILWFFTRRNPYVFIGQMSEALLTAFSTASSTATLPVTLEGAVTKAGISRKSADFVIPLGSTVNMDGTALYEAVAAVFIAQAIGFELTFGHQLIIVVTATLAAIGAAGIPEAGLVTMLIVLNAVGLPVEYIALILSVDWLLDRFRTTVNVFGDCVGAAVIERTLPDDVATA